MTMHLQSKQGEWPTELTYKRVGLSIYNQGFIPKDERVNLQVKEIFVCNKASQRIVQEVLVSHKLYSMVSNIG